MTRTERMPDIAGTRLLLQLKRMLAQAWNPGAGCITAMVPIAAQPLAPDLCVMVVDDDALNLLVASEMLRFWGVSPVLAQDGDEAVALAAEMDLDLILMDLEMPRLDGVAATREIRRVEEAAGRAPVPVIAFTMTDPSPAQLRDWGMAGRLIKPCDLNALRACMLQWCPALRGVLPTDRQAAGRAHWAALAPGRTADG